MSKQYRAYIAKIRNDWFVVEGITSSLKGYSYELVPLNLSKFIVNFDPKYLTQDHALGIRNQLSKQAYNLYGFKALTLFGVESNITTMTEI